ncbi:MAG: hypothetical protein ACRD1N_03245 [Terriglobia bacterium]
MTKKSLLLLVALLTGALASNAAITVNSKTSILIDPREPTPIRQAARDLASDMQNVFGAPVPLASQRSESSAATICIAFSHNLPKSVTRPSGWEVLNTSFLARGKKENA